MAGMIVMDAGDGTQRLIEPEAIRALVGYVEQRDGLAVEPEPIDDTDE